MKMETKFQFSTKRDKEASQRNRSGHQDNRLKNGTVPVKTGRLVTLLNRTRKAEKQNCGYVGLYIKYV